jgi:hypothetical protein
LSESAPLYHELMCFVDPLQHERNFLLYSEGGGGFYGIVIVKQSLSQLAVILRDILIGFDERVAAIGSLVLFIEELCHGEVEICDNLKFVLAWKAVVNHEEEDRVKPPLAIRSCFLKVNLVR